jgi:hypothetical protein
MPLSATHLFPLFSILSMFCTSACDKPDRIEGYRHIGTAAFRRSYAGHENWTESQLDSASRADPEYMSDDAHGDSALMFLRDMGIAQAQHLLLNHNETAMTDTVLIPHQGPGTDTAYIEKDTIDWRMALCIKSRRITHRFPMEDVSGIFVAYLLPSRRSDHPFIAVIQQYYIMNGDNYEVAVYGKTDPR